MGRSMIGKSCAMMMSSLSRRSRFLRDPPTAEHSCALPTLKDENDRFRGVAKRNSILGKLTDYQDVALGLQFLCAEL